MNVNFDNPFEAEGRWFKGNLHTHSTMSDGTRTCRQLVELYKNAGYDFLSITDHGVLTDIGSLQDRELLLIPGEEISVGASEIGTFFHIVGVNINSQIPWSDFHRGAHPQEAIDKINELGGVAIIAHPYWSGLTHNDLRNLKNYAGVEIYNTTCDVMRNLGFSASHIDGLLAAGYRPQIFATDDHHGEDRELRPLDALKAWIMVSARSRDIYDIMSSIRRGLFYSSMGPEITKIEVEKDEITVETSPVKAISFVSTPALGDKFIAEDEPLSTITRSGREGERYVRIEVTDYEGRSAWSNPIFLEKLM
jgi:hypothetical protein